VPILDTIYVTRLLVRDNVVFGAYGFDLESGTRYVIHADAVILATGGHTRIWRHTSSRRDENTGDSFRLAVEAGGRIRDPELVQFHPSGLIAPEDAAGTLVSEAARGEGGILRNRLGERFMSRYDPERMELSTRDRVALASYTEIKAGRGTPNGGVLLDVSHLPRETIMQRLPRVYHTLMELQLLDITTTPIEVAPTAHYSMGGVWVRPEDHGTGVDGLYAIGEASSGLHGANRLGGNSLIELLVFGRIVGEAAAAYSAQLSAQQRSAAALTAARTEVDELLAADGEENVRVLQRAIRNTMTEHAGVVRDEAGLLAGLAELAEIDARIADVGVHPDLAGFQDLAHAFDLKSAALAARATVDAALARRETRGCHNRSDYPELDPSLQVNFVWSGPGRLEREAIPPVPDEIAALMREVSAKGKLVE
jgi:succinate dehydrogenase flavoprotein subunit